MIVKLGQYKNLGFKKPKVIVSDNEYQTALSNLRNSLAKWEPSNGAAQIGTKVVLDFNAVCDGKELSELRGENIELVLGEGAFNDEFENNLIDLKKNETRAFEITLPNNYGEKRFQGKIVKYEVTLKSLQQFKYPDTKEKILTLLSDDEFKYENQLEIKLKNEIYAQKYKKVLKEVISKIIEKVVGSATFEFEKDELQRKAIQRYVCFMDNLQQEDISIEVFYAYNRITPGKFKTKFIKSAEDEIQMHAVIDEISKKENITISNKEIMSYKYKYLYENKLKEEAFEGVKNKIKNDMIRYKTIKYLTDVNIE